MPISSRNTELVTGFINNTEITNENDNITNIKIKLPVINASDES